MQTAHNDLSWRLRSLLRARRVAAAAALAGIAGLCAIQMSSAHASGAPASANAAADISIGTIELRAPISGVKIGAFEPSVLTIGAGGLTQSFALGAEPALQALANTIVDRFASAGVRATSIGDDHAITLLFLLPKNAASIELDCNDRTIGLRSGVSRL